MMLGKPLRKAISRNSRVFQLTIALLLVVVLVPGHSIYFTSYGLDYENQNKELVGSEILRLTSFPSKPRSADCFGVSTLISGVEGAFAKVTTDDIGGVYVTYQSYWVENSSGLQFIHVYFVYSHDYGKSWSESFRVNDDGNSSVLCDSPSIAINPNTGHVFVAWKDNRTSAGIVYIDKSLDRGVTFGSDVAVYDSPSDNVSTGNVYTVNIQTGDDEKIYVTWVAYFDYYNADCDILFARSTDGGQTFSTPSSVHPVESVSRHRHPWIAIDKENVIFVAYSEFNSTFSAVYLARSQDGGSTFETPVKVTDDSTTGYRGGKNVVISTDGKIHIAWTDGRAGFGAEYLDIYFATSLDGGLSFGPNIRVNDDPYVTSNGLAKTFTVSTQGTPSFTLDSDSRVHIVWEDFRNFESITGYCRDTYYASSDDGTRFSKNFKVNYVHPDVPSVNSADPSIITDSEDNIFLVYSDAPSGDNDVHYIYFMFAPSWSWKWPKFRHDPGNTGFSPSTAPRVNSTRWNFTTSGTVESSPAVADNMVFIGSSNKVFALNETTGEYIWNFTANNLVKTSPAVTNGQVFFGSSDKNVYSLNATNGNLLWNYTTGSAVVSSPNFADGVIFIGSNDSNLYALNQTDGQLVWNFTTESPVENSPAVVDGLVFIGYGNKMYALNETTGSIFWQKNYTVRSSPAVTGSFVFFGSNASVYSLNKTNGNFLWETPTGGVVSSSPAIAYGKVFIGCEDNKIYALDKVNGSVLWQYSTNDVVRSSPAVCDDVLFIGSSDGNLYVLNETNGELVWKYATDGEVHSSPAIADGKVYVGSHDGNLYAIGRTCDIAVTDVAPSKTVVGHGYNLGIVVTLENQGNYTETFNVTIYVNATEVETREIALLSGYSIPITFTWNTSSFAFGNYSITALVDPIEIEWDVGDNSLIADDEVVIAFPGDVDGDGDVDIFDIVKIAGRYGSEEGEPEYLANSDIDGDGDIDIFDVVIAASNYGTNL